MSEYREKYEFRQGTIGDVARILALIDGRIRWMDDEGIEQWNKNHYRERYPKAYYMGNADAGRFYVLADRKTGEVVAGAVLLDDDPRWGQQTSAAFYVHNLVASVHAAGAGSAMLHFIGDLARSRGKEYVRLDCIVGNGKLNAWYESQGYLQAGTTTDGEYRGVLREKKL